MPLADLSPARWLERRRYRAVWSDPLRKLRTLESFAQTEADGGAEIRAAVRCTTQDDLRGHLERHAQDERRHAELFRTRAAELRAAGGIARDGDATSDKDFDMRRARGQAGAGAAVEHGNDLHGGLVDSPIDEVGPVRYIAKLHVAECNAAELFSVHSSLLDDDPETQAVFDQILVDEKYHVGYTNRILLNWKKDGRAGEVKSALKEARQSRFLGSWKRLGLRSGARFGQLLMFLAYYTLALPFALIARGSLKSARSEWHDSADQATLDAARAQY